MMRFLTWKARIAAAAPAVAATTIALAASAAPAPDQRAIVFTFTPTERAQIALWIEKADGTFLGTVGLTQAVAVRGIGNRPGASQMNSGYHWPYGRREGVLPIWGRRRAAAPGAMQFPRIIFQDRSEGYASRSCADSTLDSYYCLSFTPDNTRKQLDAVTCASVFMSDKGRIIKPADVAAGYAEPTATGSSPTWQETPRGLGLTSLYPPRRDFTSCATPSTVNPCMGGTSTCWDSPDSANYGATVRAVMPDIDVVTMATPPGNVEQRVMFSVRRRGRTATTSPTWRSTPRATTTPRSARPGSRRRARRISPARRRRGTRGRWGSVIPTAGSRPWRFAFRSRWARRRSSRRWHRPASDRSTVRTPTSAPCTRWTPPSLTTRRARPAAARIACT
jgi:hypothetical protein